MKANEIRREPFITIVSGLPRSGTSMMMQMLAAGGIPVLADGIRQPDEDNPRGYYEFEQVKQIESDASWLDEAEDKVVKMVYRLLYDLPRNRAYRVVFMSRDLDEVIASQDVMLKRHGNANEGIDPAWLASVYRQQLRQVLSWLEAQPNFAVLSIDYRDVLSDPEHVVQRLNHFLDGRLDTNAMLQVPDWSLYRQRLGMGVATGTSTEN